MPPPLVPQLGHATCRIQDKDWSEPETESFGEGDKRIVSGGEAFLDHVDGDYISELFSDRTLDKNGANCKCGSMDEQFVNGENDLSYKSAVDIKNLSYYSSDNCH